jgi:alkylation response protein AidB-like acyl-CoA dehydrogenase
MNAALSGVDPDVVAAVREFVRGAFPLEQLQSALVAEPLPPAWQRADELGWLDIDVTDPASLAIAQAAVEEFGRHLFPGPLADTLVGRSLLRAVGRPLAATETVALALASGASRGAPSFTGASVADGQLRGEKAFVAYADCANWLVVSATCDAVPVLGAVSAAAAGPALRITSTQDFDAASRPCTAEFDDAPLAAVLASGETAVESMLQVRGVLGVLVASRAIGVMRQVFDMTQHYARNRVQFGRPIGSFQAVQHRLADMLLQVDTSAACRDRAVSQAMSGDGRWPESAAVARVFAARSARSVTETALQVHGGIGFTEEYVLHRYLKHAVAIQGLWGEAGSFFDETGRRLLGTAPEIG